MGQIQSGVISVDDFSDRVMGVAVAILSAQLDSALTFKPVDQINPTDKHVLPGIPGNSVDEYITYNSDTNRDHINKYITNHILDSEEHLNTFTSTLINRLARPTNQYLNAVSTPAPKKVLPPAPAPAPSIKSASTTRPVVNAPAPSPAAVPSVAKSHASVAASHRAAPEEYRSIKASQATRRSVQASQISSVPAIVPEAEQVLTELKNDISDTPSVPSIRPVKGSNKLQKRMHTIDQAIDMERIAQERLREAQANITASYEDDVNAGEAQAPVTHEDEADFEHIN